MRTELPWELLYADDLAIIDITSTDTQNRLESWQKVLTDNGLKINVAKTQHLSTRENPLPMKVNGDELKNVDHFKHLGSVIDRDGTIDRDVDLRVRAKKAVRPRKDNFTNNEILALIDAYGRRKGILQRRFKSTMSTRGQKEAWDTLTADVNAVSSSRRKPD